MKIHGLTSGRAFVAVSVESHARDMKEWRRASGAVWWKRRVDVVAAVRAQNMT
jgi:hypothetical protein